MQDTNMYRLSTFVTYDDYADFVKTISIGVDDVTGFLILLTYYPTYNLPSHQHEKRTIKSEPRKIQQHKGASTTLPVHIQYMLWFISLFRSSLLRSTIVFC